MKYSKGEIDRVRDQTTLSEIVGRFVIWDKKKSRAARGDYWACCPFHGEKKPSFHVMDQKGIYHCFGCGKTGDVFRFLSEHVGTSFMDAMEQLGGQPDAIQQTPEQRREQERRHEEKRAADKAERDAEEADTREYAYKIWRQGVPIPGTLAEGYLRGRGVDFPLDRFPSLRFHPALSYRDRQGNRLGNFPALIAAVQAPDDRFLGIWRIYLDPLLDPATKGRAKVPDAKLGLGAYTEAGGCVRLGPASGRGNVVEGIETGFGVLGILGGAGSILCALNTTGMVALQPPVDTSSFLIWPDGDVDKIRMIKNRDGEAEKKIASPGIAAAKALKANCEAIDFPCVIQPTPKTGKDYLDTYTRMKKVLR